MNSLERGLGNARRHVASHAAWTPLSDHKHTRLVLEELTSNLALVAPADCQNISYAGC